MALNGIGGGGAESALERFQAARDLAKKKLDGADNRTRLADLLKQKQSELGVKNGTAILGGPAAKPQAERIPPGVSALALPDPQASGRTAAYGRAGATEKPDPKPKLGRYIDFMA